MTATIRIAIVDDHPMVAEGIEAILESYDDIEVVATLSSGQDIIDKAPALDPDVILLDLNMPARRAFYYRNSAGTPTGYAHPDPVDA